MKGICPKCGGLVMPGTPSCLVCLKVKADTSDPTTGEVGGGSGAIRPAESPDGSTSGAGTSRASNETSPAQGATPGRSPGIYRAIKGGMSNLMAAARCPCPCPKCRSTTAVRSRGRKLVDTKYEPFRPEPGTSVRAAGEWAVKTTWTYRETFKCSHCGDEWHRESTKVATMTPWCPKCHSPELPIVLGDVEIDSRDVHTTVDREDVHLDRDLRFEGVTIRRVDATVRVTTDRRTYRCRTCSHEWSVLRGRDGRRAWHA